jgi:hypothetical protein
MAHLDFIPRHWHILAASIAITFVGTSLNAPEPNIAGGGLAGFSRLSIESDARRLEEISAILDAIPTGREALETMEGYGVAVRFEKGSGTYFHGSHNLVVVDSGKTPLDAAIALVHEMTHAGHFHEGLTADEKTLPRDEYVERRLEEEAEGETRSIEAKLELNEAGFDVSRVFPLFETWYIEAARAEAVLAKARNSRISEAELKAVTREAARRAIFNGLRHSAKVGALDGASYPAYYGGYWDAVHQDRPQHNTAQAQSCLSPACAPRFDPSALGEGE